MSKWFLGFVRKKMITEDQKYFQISIQNMNESLLHTKNRSCIHYFHGVFFRDAISRKIVNIPPVKNGRFTPIYSIRYQIQVMHWL